MGLDASLRTLILADAGIATIVGPKVRPVSVAAGETVPFLTYEIRKGETIDTLSDGPADYKNAQVELGIFGSDYDTTADLSERLQTYLDGTATATAGVEIDVWFSEETEIEAVAEGEDEPQYVRVQTYDILYKVAPEQ